jgi:hypothetical protein
VLQVLLEAGVVAWRGGWPPEGGRHIKLHRTRAFVERREFRKKNNG